LSDLHRSIASGNARDMFNNNFGWAEIMFGISLYL